MVRLAQPIDIRPTDRVFIVGASGSGKTRLLTTEIIPRFAFYPPVVLDPKGDFPVLIWRGKTVERVSNYHPGQPQVLHVPRRQQSPAKWDDIIGAILDNQNQTIIIDDIYAINAGNANPRPELLWAISGGRSIHCPVYVGVQRPSRLPISAISEAEHYFVFTLRNPDDRKTMIANTSPEMAKYINRLGEHDYIYYHAVPPRRLVVVKQ